MAVRTSTLGDHWAPVVVETSDDGLIVVKPVGAVPIPTHVGGAIDVAGATLVVDARPGARGGAATAGSVPPTATIFDPYWALTWLAGVYGDTVVEQVKMIAREPAHAAVNVDARFGYLSDAMVRLGIATWLHRWWPAGNRDLDLTFSPELLELEVGALRWIAEAAFIEKGPIARVLRPHLALLHSLYDWNQTKARPGQRQDLVGEVLVAALRAAVDTLSDSTDGYQDCLDLLNAIDTGVQVTYEDWVRFEELLQQGVDAGLLVRGKGEQPPGSDDVSELSWLITGEGRVTYDVRDVPPRTLADVEDNIRWYVHEADGFRRLTVEAEAAPTLVLPPAGPPLMARAFLDGEPLLFRLEWTPEDGHAIFQGATLIPDDLTSASVEVGVFHPTWGGEARLSGPSRERAEQERREVIGILTNRRARLGERLAQSFVKADPAERPTAAEVMAQRRG